MSALEKIKLVLESNEGRTPESIYAIYGASGWNSLSWSYLLIKDLLAWQGQCALSDGRERDWLPDFFWKRRFREHFSAHGDASKKVFLYQVLEQKKRCAKLVIPEVGPCGFDLIPAILAGYEEIRVFDINPDYIGICKGIWGDRVARYDVMDSKGYFERNQLGLDFDVIVPDWSHHDIRHPNSIHYADRSDFFRHWKKIRKDVFFRFFKELNKVSL
jgi:hypothetical protein